MSHIDIISISRLQMFLNYMHLQKYARKSERRLERLYVNRRKCKLIREVLKLLSNYHDGQQEMLLVRYSTDVVRTRTTLGDMKENQR